MVSILIPLYNEEEQLPRSLPLLLNHLPEEGEVLLIDNGSVDGTAVVANELCANFPHVRYFHLEKRGPGLAFRLGVQEARNEKIVCLDADLSSDLCFIHEASKLLDNAEAVIGSKSFGSQRRKAWRVGASLSYIFFTQFLLDLSFSDYSIGSKAFRRSAVLPALSHLDPWTGYILELILYLQSQRARLLEIPVSCDDLRKSRFSLSYEGFYRFRHLFQLARARRSGFHWTGQS